MAYSHYEVDENEKPGRDLMEALRKLRHAWDLFSAVRGQIIQQKDADTDFTSVAERFGYAGDDAAAKEANAEASFGEINSAFGNADAAITQMLDRHL